MRNITHSESEKVERDSYDQSNVASVIYPIIWNKLTPKQRYFAARSAHSRVHIPATLLKSMCDLGRAKYSAVVVSALLSILWDGWSTKRTKKCMRIPRQDVLFTRRMAQSWFGIPEATADRAIKNLRSIKLISECRKGSYSGDPDKNRGTTYKLSWLPKAKETPAIWLYWGLLASKPFCRRVSDRSS